MYYIYILTHKDSDKFYVGFTNNVNRRLITHKYASTRRKNKLYDFIKKYGWGGISCDTIASSEDKAEILLLEKILISTLKPDLNLAAGGEGGFVVKDVESWKQKLSEARRGYTPALGMSHTEENKKKFSEASKKRWDIYGRYPKEVLAFGFTEANRKFGISKTHYYRLVKQNKINELVRT